MSVRSSADGIEARILRTIQRSRKRVIVGRLLGGLAEVLAVGLLLSLAFGAVADSVGFSSAIWVLFFSLLALSGLSYVAWVTRVGSSPRAVAIVLDRALRFRDRVSSALLFLGEKQRTSFMEAHLEETAAFLQTHGDDSLPVHWPGQGRAFVVFLVLCFVSLLPHGERVALSRIEHRTEVQAKVEVGRALLREMRQLREQADLRGLKKLSEMVAVAEEVLQRRIELLAPEDLEVPLPVEVAEKPKSAGNTTAEESDAEDAKAPELQAGTASNQERMRLSSAATYQAVGKFDSFPEAAYTEVFAELDGVVVDSPMTGKELTNLAEHVDKVAGTLNNFGFLSDSESVGTEGMLRGPRGGNMVDNSFEQALAPLAYKAFSEFLKRYSAHLGEQALGQAKWEMGKEDNDGGELFNISAPPPKDARFALKGVSDRRPNLPILQASADQAGKVAAQAASQGSPGPSKPSGVKGSGTELGGSGAGVGAPDRSGAPPGVLPRAEGGSYLPLRGKLSDGESMIELINDRGRRNLAAHSSGAISYRDVFLEYSHGAEAELNGEDVPPQMRDYIREYFRSIRPVSESAPNP